MVRLVLVLLAFWGAPAFADTDYLCLKHCSEAGGNPTSCVKQCEVPVLVKKKKDDGKEEAGSGRDKQFGAPKKTSKVVLEQEVIELETRTDHVCLQMCLKEGLAYGLCDKRCTTLANPPAGLERVRTGERR